MPGGDRTGPFGAGPMTGRGLGFCGGNDAPEYPYGRRGLGRMFGQSCGRFAGRGRGFRRWFSGGGAEAAGTDDIDFLKRRSESLGRALAGVNARISELEKKE